MIKMRRLKLGTLIVLCSAFLMTGCGGGGGTDGSSTAKTSVAGTWGSSTWDNANWAE